MKRHGTKAIFTTMISVFISLFYFCYGGDKLRDHHYDSVETHHENIKTLNHRNKALKVIDSKNPCHKNYKKNESYDKNSDNKCSLKSKVDGKK